MYHSMMNAANLAFGAPSLMMGLHSPMMGVGNRDRLHSPMMGESLFGTWGNNARNRLTSTGYGFFGTPLSTYGEATRDVKLFQFSQYKAFNGYAGNTYGQVASTYGGSSWGGHDGSLHQGRRCFDGQYSIDLPRFPVVSCFCDKNHQDEDNTDKDTYDKFCLEFLGANGGLRCRKGEISEDVTGWRSCYCDKNHQLNDIGAPETYDPLCVEYLEGDGGRQCKKTVKSADLDFWRSCYCDRYHQRNHVDEEDTYDPDCVFQRGLTGGGAGTAFGSREPTSLKFIDEDELKVISSPLRFAEVAELATLALDASGALTSTDIDNLDSIKPSDFKANQPAEILKIYDDESYPLTNPACEGWYFKNVKTGTTHLDKINWYYINHDDNNGDDEDVALGDYITSFFVTSIDGSGDTYPFVSMYTKPEINQSGGWYSSRITYSIPSSEYSRISQGDRVFLFVGQDAPSLFPELEHIEMVQSAVQAHPSSGTSGLGNNDPTQLVLKAAFGTNSGAVVNQVELCVEYLVSVRDDGSTNKFDANGLIPT